MADWPFIDRHTAAFSDFQNIYLTGNPTALHEVLEYCQTHGLTPPLWAKDEIQRILKLHFSGEVEVGIGAHAHKPIKYRGFMDKAIRRQAYIAVRRWQFNPRKFEGMPTRALRLWCEGKLDPTCKTKKYARHVTCVGLTGTYHVCSEEQLRKLVFEWKLDDDAIRRSVQQPPFEGFLSGETVLTTGYEDDTEQYAPDHDEEQYRN